jgi:NCS1 family nucleobase:cation symporter-1
MRPLSPRAHRGILAVNLVDCYLVRHGHCVVEDFKRDGGRMIIGTAYTGPMAKPLGNTDVSQAG